MNFSFKCLNTFWRHCKKRAKLLVILQCNMLWDKIRLLFFTWCEWYISILELWSLVIRQQAACYSSGFSLIEALTVSGWHEDWHHEVSRRTQNTLTTCKRLKMELFCSRAWPHLQLACWNDSLQGYTDVYRDAYSMKALFVLLTPKLGNLCQQQNLSKCSLAHSVFICLLDIYFYRGFV